MITAPPMQIEIWPIDRLVLYARNPRKKDSAVDRMCSGIREFGFKIPVLARSDGEVVDGHLRSKAASKMGSWPGRDTSGYAPDAQVPAPRPGVELPLWPEPIRISSSLAEIRALSSRD
jgi:hypothetical protein